MSRARRLESWQLYLHSPAPLSASHVYRSLAESEGVGSAFVGGRLGDGDLHCPSWIVVEFPRATSDLQNPRTSLGDVIADHRGGDELQLEVEIGFPSSEAVEEG